MSRANGAGGWLKGTTIRKGGTTTTNPHSTRSNTPQVQSTSTTIFGGGVKDASGRTTEYFVRPSRDRLSFSETHHGSLWMINVLYANPIDILTQSCACSSARVITKCTCTPRISFPQLNPIASRCESCIDRLFTLGPAPCPICQKILRKLAFSPQTFEDLAVEKEVAVRRRIAKE